MKTEQLERLNELHRLIMTAETLLKELLGTDEDKFESKHLRVFGTSLGWYLPDGVFEKFKGDLIHCVKGKLVRLRKEEANYRYIDNE